MPSAPTVPASERSYHVQKLIGLSANASEKLRVVGNVFNPKVSHNSAYIIRPEAPVVRLTAAQVSYLHSS